jgi:hypothetical protein
MLAIVKTFITWLMADFDFCQIHNTKCCLQSVLIDADTEPRHEKSPDHLGLDRNNSNPASRQCRVPIPLKIHLRRSIELGVYNTAKCVLPV